MLSLLYFYCFSLIGYPEHIAFGDFRRRFDILLDKDDRHVGPILDEKQVRYLF